MHIRNKIFTALMVLFVFSGQAMANGGQYSYGMNMPQMEMNQIDCDVETMDCCYDNGNCASNCNFSASLILNGMPSSYALPDATQKISFAHILANSHPLTSLLRPPIVR